MLAAGIAEEQGPISITQPTNICSYSVGRAGCWAKSTWFVGKPEFVLTSRRSDTWSRKQLGNAEKLPIVAKL